MYCIAERAAVIPQAFCRCKSDCAKNGSDRHLSALGDSVSPIPTGAFYCPNYRTSTCCCRRKIKRRGKTDRKMHFFEPRAPFSEEERHTHCRLLSWHLHTTTSEGLRRRKKRPPCVKVTRRIQKGDPHKFKSIAGVHSHAHADYEFREGGSL